MESNSGVSKNKLMCSASIMTADTKTEMELGIPKQYNETASYSTTSNNTIAYFS